VFTKEHEEEAENRTLFARAHLSLAVIAYSLRLEPQPQALVVGEKHAEKADNNKSFDNQS
jgi:hypothetical protein